MARQDCCMHLLLKCSVTRRLWLAVIFEQRINSSHLVLSYVQLFSECYDIPLDGGGLHLYAFQGGSIGLGSLRIFWVYQSGQVFLASIESVEGRAVLEIYACSGVWYFRPLYFHKQSNGFHGRKRLLQSFLCCSDKHIPLGREEIGVHLSYLYNKRKEYKLNGMAAGITYNPSFHPQLRLIVEYDSKDFAFGATYCLFKYLHFQVEMQKMQYFSGGLTVNIHLKWSVYKNVKGMFDVVKHPFFCIV